MVAAGQLEMTMVMGNVPEQLTGSVAVIVELNVPAVVGVPESTPAVVMDSPGIAGDMVKV